MIKTFKLEGSTLLMLNPYVNDLKILINKLYAELQAIYSSCMIQEVCLITIPRILGFLSASGIILERLQPVAFHQNEYTDHIFTNFQKYWQPEIIENTPQVFIFKGTNENVMHQSSGFRLEYDKGRQQLRIYSG